MVFEFANPRGVEVMPTPPPGDLIPPEEVQEQGIELSSILDPGEVMPPREESVPEVAVHSPTIDDPNVFLFFY